MPILLIGLLMFRINRLNPISKSKQSLPSPLSKPISKPAKHLKIYNNDNDIST